MSDSFVISSAVYALGGHDVLPAVRRRTGASFGLFELRRLERTTFDDNQDAARQRHTPVSFRMSRMTGELMAMAGFEPDGYVGADTGIVSGSSYGCAAVFDLHRRLCKGGPRGIDAVRFAQATHSFPISMTAIDHGLKGPAAALVSSDAAGTEALVCALDWLRDGLCTRVVVAAFEDFDTPIAEHVACTMPEGTGSVSEAMVLLLVETAAAAVERRAPVLAEITGLRFHGRRRDRGAQHALCLRLPGAERGPDASIAGADDPGNCLGATDLIKLALLVTGGSPLGPARDRTVAGSNPVVDDMSAAISRAAMPERVG